MNPFVTAVVLVGVIGLICSLILAAASKIMYVETDERIELLREALPGLNCGACGFAGCDGYAAALLEEEGVRPNLCAPGAQAVALRISGILGVAYQEAERQVALVHCRGDLDVTQDKMDYEGITTCDAAKMFFGGKGACTFGCLGFGDCAAVCPSDAIHVENGLAVVNASACTSCGLCAKTCPNHLITVSGITTAVAVKCSNRNKGGVAKKLCVRACIACGRCVRECPVGAITITENLAVIDYKICTGCGQCTTVCPSHCLEFTNLCGAAGTRLAV